MARMIDGKLHDIWSVDDVQAKAEEMGVNITLVQCVSVLENAARRHDATVGINWDVIGFWIGEVATNAVTSTKGSCCGHAYKLEDGSMTENTYLEGRYVCKFCDSHEVGYNQGVNDAYCTTCGEWQNEQK